MEKEDYELIPHELLQDLRDEVEALKKKLLQPDAKAEQLILEMESLKDSIHDLTTIFQKALEQMKDDDSANFHKSIVDKLNVVMQQNDALAKSIIMLSEKMERHHRTPLAGSPPGSRAHHTVGIPSSPMQGPRIAPPLMMEQPVPFNPPPTMNAMPSPADFPPPPPSPDKKRFGLFK